LKFRMGMKEGFNPVLAEKILLNWIYLYLRLTKIGRMVDFLSYPIK